MAVMTRNSSRHEFRFEIDVDSTLEAKTNSRLVELLTLAPPDASAVGLLQRDEKSFLSAIEVQSKFLTFFEIGYGPSPEVAVQRALNRLEDRLYEWRFGGGSKGESAKAIAA